MYLQSLKSLFLIEDGLMTYATKVETDQLYIRATWSKSKLFSERVFKACIMQAASVDPDKTAWRAVWSAHASDKWQMPYRRGGGGGGGGREAFL